MATAVPGSSTRVVRAKVVSTVTVLTIATTSIAEVGARLSVDPEVCRGDEREDEQRDRAADRGDRAQVEADREDDRGGGGQGEPGGQSTAEPATHERRELPDLGHLLAETACRVEAGVRRARGREQRRHAHEPVPGAPEDRLRRDRDRGAAGGDHLVDREGAEHAERRRPRR